MLIASLLEPSPTNHNTGDYWYCYADRNLYELRSLSLYSQWVKVNPGTFVSPAPPPLLALPHVPPRPIWIKHGDPNRVPHVYDLAANYWIPVIPIGFTLPPLLPSLGATWFDSQTMHTFLFTGPTWLDMTNSIGSPGAVGQTTHHAPLQAQNPSKWYSITPAPVNAQPLTPKAPAPQGTIDDKPKYSDYDRAMKGIK